MLSILPVLQSTVVGGGLPLFLDQPHRACHLPGVWLLNGFRDILLILFEPMVVLIEPDEVPISIRVPDNINLGEIPHELLQGLPPLLHRDGCPLGVDELVDVGVHVDDGVGGFGKFD